jgi:hypothetical protein
MTDLEVQAMVVLDAIEAEDPRAETLLIPMRARMIAHGEREGRKDYEGRAKDVAAGSAEPQWAWAGTFLNADDAYLDAVSEAAPSCARSGCRNACGSTSRTRSGPRLPLEIRRPGSTSAAESSSARRATMTIA